MSHQVTEVMARLFRSVYRFVQLQTLHFQFQHSLVHEAEQGT